MSYYASLAIVIAIYMHIWFVVALIKQRNDVADIAWGIGFVMLAWVAYGFAGDASGRALLVNTLVTMWGVRLSTHIYLRNRHKPEDPRYRAWRAGWGRWAIPRAYVSVFLLQGTLLYLISIPVLHIQHAAAPLGIYDLLGVLVWITGFAFEVIGDWQLARFVRNPAHTGTLMQSGLWKYSRHPNYFGEVMQWWGIFIMALATPDAWWTIIGPITITILIRFVSGVPLLERKYAGRADFEAYRRRTNVFFPLPPRSL